MLKTPAFPSKPFPGHITGYHWRLLAVVGMVSSGWYGD